MPTPTPLTVTPQNINDALYQALFARGLQQSDNGPHPLTGEHPAGKASGGTPAGGRVTGCSRPHLNGASPGQS